MIISNLNKTYNKKYVLKNINLRLEAGEIVGLVGENGAGKSTLMKIISGLVKQDSGIVTLNNLSFNKNRIEYLKSVSAIIEEPALYLEMTGIDHIKFISNINRVSPDNITKIIDFINIGSALSRKTSTYSMGMKQRLALGLALLKEPRLLILDEPTNGLDIQSSIELRKNILSLAKEKNITILISSHILSEIEKICDRVIFIKGGTIINDNFRPKESKIKSIKLDVNNKMDFINFISRSNYILNYIEEIDNIFKVNIKSDLVKRFVTDLSLSEIQYSNISILEESLEDKYLSIGEDR